MAGALAGAAGLRASCPSLRALAQSAVPEMTIAITDVTVIDATGAPPRPTTTVVIEGDRIAEIRHSRRLGANSRWCIALSTVRDAS